MIGGISMNVAYVGSLDKGFAVIDWCKKNDAALDNFSDRKSKSW